MDVTAVYDGDKNVDWSELLKNMVHLEEVIAEMKITENMILPDILQPQLGKFRQIITTVNMSLHEGHIDYLPK